MSIKLYNGKVESGVSKYYQEANLTETEKNAIAQIKTVFEEKTADFSEIFFKRMSSNYLSMFYREYDFCRIKVGSRSCWFSVLSSNLPDNIKSDIRFEKSDKKLLHWKVNVESISDFKSIADLILDSYLSVKKIKE